MLETSNFGLLRIEKPIKHIMLDWITCPFTMYSEKAKIKSLT